MLDPATHQQMRVAARKAACSASWDRVFEELWESYNACLRLPARKAQPPSVELRNENAA